MNPSAEGRLPPGAPALERARALFDPVRVPAVPDTERGWLDLLGEEDPTGSHPGQQLMLSGLLAAVYERAWRPLGGRLLMGAGGPDMREEHSIALEMLALTPGESVLDIACGPGNFTRGFASEVGDGLVVGLDASRAMLARAVAETRNANVAYLRADACALPFRDGSFAAICCFAALYLIDDPERALDEIARVLAPGGRVALLTSCKRGPLPLGPTDAVVRALTGVRIFGHDELTSALRRRGLAVAEQRVSGFAQFVSAQRPPATRTRRGSDTLPASG